MESVRDRDDHPHPPWNVEGGGVLVNVRGGGACQFFRGRMMSRGQCPRQGGGGAAFTSPPPPPSGNPVSVPDRGPGFSLELTQQQHTVTV